MPHFFINSEDVKENKIVISDKENFTHIAKSLRIKAGEKLLLIDENQIQYEKNKFSSKCFLKYDCFIYKGGKNKGIYPFMCLIQ